MSNRFGIPADVEQRLRVRHTRCAYCHKRYSKRSRKDWATIEHLNEEPPFRWKRGEALKEEGLVICCASCNCSRGKKPLREWFRAPYCAKRVKPINAVTVAAAVKRYLLYAR